MEKGSSPAGIGVLSSAFFKECFRKEVTYVMDQNPQNPMGGDDQGQQQPGDMPGGQTPTTPQPGAPMPGSEPMPGGTTPEPTAPTTGGETPEPANPNPDQSGGQNPGGTA